MVLLYKDPNGESITENTHTHPISIMSISVRDNVFQLSNNNTPRSKAGNQQLDHQVESCSNHNS